MAKKQVDIESTEVTLAPDESVTLELNSQSADSTYLTVDGGAPDIEPNVYNIVTRVDLDVGFDFQKNEILTITRSVGVTHKNSAYGRYMEFELTNVSEESATYRFTVETYSTNETV